MPMNIENELKKKYDPVFKTHTLESQMDVYFRLMTKREYDTFMSLCNGEDITPAAEDYVLDNIVVYPYDNELNDNLFAGEVKQIVSEVAKRSGFFRIDEFAEELKLRRALTQTLAEQIIVFISKAFPVYTIEDLEGKNYKQICRLLAAAELMLGQKLEVIGDEYPQQQQPPKVDGNPILRGREDENKLAEEAQQRATSLMQKYKQGQLRK